MAEGPSAAFGSIAGKVEGDLAWSRQKRMMQNRHQWEVKDLRKAGLNPILSAGAAPSMASVSQTKLPDFGSDMGMSGAATRKTQKRQRSVMAEQKLLINAQTAKTNAERDSIRQQIERYEGVSNIGGVLGEATQDLRSGGAMKTFEKTLNDYGIAPTDLISGGAKVSAELERKAAAWYKKNKPVLLQWLREQGYSKPKAKYDRSKK